MLNFTYEWQPYKLFFRTFVFCAFDVLVSELKEACDFRLLRGTGQEGDVNIVGANCHCWNGKILLERKMISILSGILFGMFCFSLKFTYEFMLLSFC